MLASDGDKLNLNSKSDFHWDRWGKPKDKLAHGPAEHSLSFTYPKSRFYLQYGGPDWGRDSPSKWREVVC